MRIVSWNIRAGGGRRAGAILAQIEAWSPDVVALSEFRGTPPCITLAEGLEAAGLPYQLASVDRAAPARNALLIASRTPLRAIRLRTPPADRTLWLLAEVAGPQPFTLGAMHIPNEVTKRKFPYMEAVSRITESWRRGPALFVGDTNSGRAGLDEENAVFGPRYDAWFDRLAAAGWHDAFRHLHGEQREFTWYSPNGGNGFRLDQALVNRTLLPRLSGAAHQWGVDPAAPARRDALSDHAALIVDFA